MSGGNIQKLVLARELSRDPGVLIAAQPTRGVDIGATEYIHQRLLQERDQGTAILLISEDLDEIRALSDRIAVMYEGRIVGEVENVDVDIEQLGLVDDGWGVARPPISRPLLPFSVTKLCYCCVINLALFSFDFHTLSALEQPKCPFA